MERASEQTEQLPRASVGDHLALAPVAFAVTHGSTHELMYANPAFRQLMTAREIAIGSGNGDGRRTSDLTTLLDRVLESGKTLRDEVLHWHDGALAPWMCTIWPVRCLGRASEDLVIEIRNVALIEAAKARQRAITERLLLGALQDQDVAREAEDASRRARHLSNASRDLALSLDEKTTRETVRRLALPRRGTWCIVDVVEPDGTRQRLPVVHPDPAIQALVRKLGEQSPDPKGAAKGLGNLLASARPVLLTNESEHALVDAAHGEDNLRILREIGFGALLVVPLVVRARVQGAMTFVSPKGEEFFSADEIALATDLAARGALALDNARLYHEADTLRLAADLANQSKSQFLSSMSHELRTPLSAIAGFVELVDMGITGPVTAEQHEALGRVKANQEHLLTLITEILDFTRIGSGRVEYHNGALSMSDALADVASMLTGAIADKGLRLDGPRGDSGVIAWADRDRVRQILMNLVMNAVKYVPSGGTVSLECAVDGDKAIARVSDTGPGIPPERLAMIFEPFVQLTAGLADRQGGVGLGLSISRDLARAMDGDLIVESTVGTGSRFTLVLPVPHPTEDAHDAVAERA